VPTAADRTRRGSSDGAQRESSGGVRPKGSDGSWPENADTVDRPRELTVFGVDPADGGVPAALRSELPDDADLLVLDRPAEELSLDERATGYLHNPALLFWGLVVAIGAFRDRSFYGTAGRASVHLAVEDVAAERGLPVVAAGRHPLAAASESSGWWRIGGWIAALTGFLGAASVAVLPGGGTALFLLTALALVAAYLLAYSGARMDADADRLFVRTLHVAEERGARHPVAVVRSSRRAGVVRRAKSARIRTRERQLSPVEDDADAEDGLDEEDEFVD